MTEARKAARVAAKEVIEQTEINIRDLRKSLWGRAHEAAADAVGETPWQYRDERQQKECCKIAREVVDELLGVKE